MSTTQPTAEFLVITQTPGQQDKVNALLGSVEKAILLCDAITQPFSTGIKHYVEKWIGGKCLGVIHATNLCKKNKQIRA